MATFTSKASGLWSATGQTTWNEAGVPTGADSVTIGAGHVVDYDANLTHTAAIVVQAGGTLRGNGTRTLILSNVTLTVEAGGAIRNTGGIFLIQIAAASSQSSAILVLTGTEASHVIVAGESAANYIRVDHGAFSRGGKTTATWTDFDFVGSSSVPAFQFSGAAGSDIYSWTHCTFSATCGRIQNTTALGNTCSFIFDDNKYYATWQIFPAILASAAVSTGIRSIQRNYFAGSLGTSGSGGSWVSCTIKHNVFRGLFYVAGTTTWGVFEFNFMQVLGVNPLTQPSNTSDTGPNYMLIHNPAAAISNLRALQPTISRDVTIAGWILEPGNSNTSGDYCYPAAPASPRVYTYEKNLILPSGKTGNRGGNAFSLNGTANCTIAIRNNTFFTQEPSGDTGGIGYGETYAGHPGIISEIKSNLAWGDGDGNLFERKNTYTVQDGCFAANITHNGKFGLATGEYGIGYADSTPGQAIPMYSTGTPGANDVVANPEFVDTTRNIGTWAVARGYSVSTDYDTRITDAYTALAVDPQARLEDLITWVRAGFAPANQAFKGAAHDGGDIGAVPVLPVEPVLFTSKAAGNWSSSGQTTWNEVGVPANRDTVTINHAINVDVNTTIGHSPGAGDALAAILIGSGGTLTVNEGITLTCRGDVKHNHASTKRNIINIVGGHLLMDPTAASDPTTAVYTIGPTSNSQSNSYIGTSAGIGGTRAWISTNRPVGTEAKARFSLHGFNTFLGLFNFANTDFTDLGDASNPMAVTYLGGTTTRLDVVNCKFLRCGAIDAAIAFSVQSTVIITGNQWIDTQGSYCFTMNSLTTPTTGIRTFTGNILDKAIGDGYWRGFTCTHNVFGDTWIEANPYGPLVFRYNVLLKSAVSSPAFYGALYQDFYFIAVTPTDLNQQGPRFTSTSQNQTVDGMIGQMVMDISEVDDFEMFMGSVSAPTRTHIFKNSITLSASDPATGLPQNAPSGCIYVGILTTPAKIEYEHNTCRGGDPARVMQPIWLAHPGFNVPADSVPRYQSNLYWDTSARGNHFQESQSGRNNIATPSGVTHNAAYNYAPSVIAGTSLGTAYSYTSSGVAPGANDVNGQDPQFIDPDRNFEKFATLHGQPRSVAGTLAVLTADPVTRIPELLAYVREGFTPQNPLLKGAAHDGGDIGAVPVQVPPSVIGGSKVTGKIRISGSGRVK